MTQIKNLVGVILAGGLAKRMGGGDKCLLPLAGKTLLQRIIDRAQPQLSTLLLNANGSSLRFARSRLPVIADQFANNLGPLAGIHSALTWMKANKPDHEWLISFASDTPFYPTNLAEKLLESVTDTGALIAVPSSLERAHPTFSLWHLSLLEEMTEVLRAGEIPRLQDWINTHKTSVVNFPADNYDPFFNINTPQDLYTAEGFINITT